MKDEGGLNFVTDDNSGGFFVCECGNCGHVFNSKDSSGGQPIADTGDYDDCRCPQCGEIDPAECENPNLVWNVQQEKINKLQDRLTAAESELQKVRSEFGRIESVLQVEQFGRSIKESYHPYMLVQRLIHELRDANRSLESRTNDRDQLRAQLAEQTTPAESVRQSPNKADVPEHFQIVPVELTQDMVDAFNEADELYEDGEGVKPDCHWSAMLAAAPLKDE